MMKKRSVIALLLIGCMTLALASCGSKNKQEESAASAASQASSEPQTSESQTSETGENPAVGGWEICEDGPAAVPADAQEAFDKAIQGYTGMNFEPKALLATQVVSGTNYAFLCLGERVVQNPVKGWYVVVVYQDLQGEAKITSVEEIEIPEIKTKENVDGPLVGGWTVSEPSNAVVLEDSIREAFQAAAEKNLGVTLTPAAQLSRQLVNGNNYLILCQGTTVTKEPVTSLYIATLYVSLEGEGELTDVELFDLTAYIDN